ncbi:4Fe-4S dicluster domain-containing protein [Actinomycetospora atypica]|uniref:Ferredoxin family protein n=1 Tax=Actinomycetospora atypica TaxID=1290095 RepID=A0ABV9YF70_9PSEU
MIEVISEDRCIDCGVCVDVCPTNVFDADERGRPTIARQSDCQTCFLCEAYCPTDALFVAPLSGPAPEGSPLRDEDVLARADQFGAYRRVVGWGHGRAPGSVADRNQVFTARLRSLRGPDTTEPGRPPA